MSKQTIEEMLDEIENANNGAGPDPVASVYRGKGLAQLAAAIQAEKRAQEAIAQAVSTAREEGATWEMIGDYLGMTRAGAYKKFKSLQVA